jgi:hypothetical protein
MIRRSVHPRLRSRSGVTIVESAIVLTVLTLIVVGILDVGIAVLRYNSLSDAARRLARTVVVHGAMAEPQHAIWGPDEYSAAASDNSAIAAAVRPLLIAASPDDVSIHVEWIDGGNEPDQRVRVTLRHTHAHFVPSLMGGSPVPLEAVSTMRIAH